MDTGIRRHIFVRRQTPQGSSRRCSHFSLRAGRRAEEMKKAPKDSLLRKIKDGEQLALKISMNSIYGVTGAKTANWASPILVSRQGRSRDDRPVRQLPAEGVQRHRHLRRQRGRMDGIHPTFRGAVVIDKIGAFAGGLLWNKNGSGGRSRPRSAAWRC